jgi:hypothetical protein
MAASQDCIVSFLSITRFLRGRQHSLPDKIAVADWGLADELTFHFMETEHILEEFGVEVEDKDAYYHFQTRQTFIWPYDGQARLIGEHLYVDATSATVERIDDPSELVTPE